MLLICYQLTYKRIVINRILPIFLFIFINFNSDNNNSSRTRLNKQGSFKSSQSILSVDAWDSEKRGLLWLANDVLGFGWGQSSWNNQNLQFGVSDCPTFDGNRTGICVSTAAECRNRGGRRLGTCYSNQGGINGQNNQFGGQSGYGYSYGPALGVAVGVCCSIQVTCGGTIRYNGTYFRNPNAPAPYTDFRSCSVTVARQPNICQVRLDFLKFDLDRPRSGVCENDRFVVSGQASNSIIPPLCGYNSGQHMYIDMAEGNFGPITLNVITIGNRPRIFDMRVTYIPCHSPFKAPPNCLQYQNSLIGQIKSFNFEEFTVGTGTGYLSGLDYTICFKRPAGYCSITYSVPRLISLSDSNQGIIQQQSSTQANFQVNPGQYFNIMPTSGMVNNEREAGAGPYECATDYLQLAGTQLCGSRLNSQLNPPAPNPTTNADVVDNSTGPIYARFVSNWDGVGRGFLLDYRFNPCMVAASDSKGLTKLFQGKFALTQLLKMDALRLLRYGLGRRGPERSSPGPYLMPITIQN